MTTEEKNMRVPHVCTLGCQLPPTDHLPKEKPVAKPDVLINMCGGAITWSVIVGSLMKAGLHWEMHPAQLFSIEINTLYAEGKVQEVFERNEEKSDELICELIPHTRYTLCGFPVMVRADFPESWISLINERGHEVIRIECCAVPSVFCDWRDWQVHQKDQEAKAVAVCRERQE